MWRSRYFFWLLLVATKIAMAHPGIHEQVDVLNERLKKQPTYQLYAQRAHLYFEDGQVDLALKDLEIASKLGPQEPLLFEYGNIYAAKSNYGKALKYYDQFIKFNNSFYEVYQARARALIRLGRTDDAIKDFKHSFELQQFPHPGLYIEAANLMYEEKDHDFQAAIGLLDEGIKRLGVQGQLQERAIQLLTENKKLAVAAERMRELGKERNNNVFWRYDYALILIKGEKKLEAQNELKRAAREAKGLNGSAVEELKFKIEKQLADLK
jgi:predicted Zn-dependent protease